jgi:hypothetical protein
VDCCYHDRCIFSHCLIVLGLVQFVVIRVVLLLFATVLYGLTCKMETFDTAILAVSWVLFSGFFVLLCVAMCCSVKSAVKMK